ncbi:MFS transporter [Acinetobacter chinensis]|jgi:DHA1 family inner membrane transport protein|uniref:MFS transporter n=1 Tax=Acinetobacter chinensis TaxID=2004650 RepID=A0ABU3WEZ4_9GAMM|nr:MFS transporter [Acinetobacter chinensis]MDV2468970.1 MFS transporter [Acinetobacter chinensis]WOE40236.1 MFS transporter [Acinetobacter chinensis]
MSSSAASPSISRPSLTLIILALAIGGFCIGTTEFVAMGLIQEISKDLNLSIPVTGHFISAYALGVTVGAPVIAILAAQVPRKILLTGLMLFYGIANAMTALTDQYSTVLISRFIAGLPHGAYFGIAALVVAEYAGKNRRASAVAKLMLGLNLATVIGVPFATWLGQNYGWRSGFEFSASLAFLTVVAISFCVPQIAVDRSASIINELKGLRNLRMWMTLAVGAIGFGGLFSVYSYVSPILTEYTQQNITVVPFALAIIGMGLVTGGLVAGYFADKNLNRAIVVILLSNACSYLICALSMQNIYTAYAGLFLVSFSIAGLAPLLQTRLMDVAGNAQGLAASLNHSAFNIANAVGAFLGGWVIAEGMGWLAPIWLGTALSLGGLAVLCIAFAMDRNQNKI